MTCEHCCGADALFDSKEAKKQLRRYRKHGPRKTSQQLINAILALNTSEKSIIDIGGGIGAVHLELLNKGFSKAINVDASLSYGLLAKEEAKNQGQFERINYLHGDFLDHLNTIEISDVVVLDKVICCYPNMKELISEASAKSNSLLALVYPKSNALGKFIIGAGNLLLWLKKNPFRTFLHSNQKVRELIHSKDFELRSRDTVYPWNIEVYKKVN